MFFVLKITLSDIFCVLKITLSATKVVVYFGLCKYFSHKYYQSPKFIFLKTLSNTATPFNRSHTPNQKVHYYEAHLFSM